MKKPSVLSLDPPPFFWDSNLGMDQNPIPLVNMKIAGKWMFIPLKMVCIGIDP